MRKYVSKVFILLTIILLTACSSKPSDEELQTQITNYLAKGGRDKLYIVENFQKVNGFENDEHTYTAQVQYDLVFKVDLQDAAQYMGEESSSSFVEQGIAAIGLLSLTAQYGNFKAGDRVPQEEKVVLIKTEKGWRLKEEFIKD